MHSWIDEPIPVNWIVDTTPTEDYFERIHQENLKEVTYLNNASEGKKLLAMEFDTIQGIWHSLMPDKHKDKIGAILKNNPNFTLRPINS